MTRYSDAARTLVAKTSAQRDRYLPLWMHLADTESVIVRLVRDWLPEAAVRAMEDDLRDGELLRVCRFLALTHDLGKATPAFQDKVAALVDGARDRLGACGLTWKNVVPGASPHALAGEELLLAAHCSPAIASIVGAHHGKPTSIHSRADVEQLCHFHANYYGTQPSAWTAAQQNIIDYAVAQAGYASVADVPPLSVPAQMLVAGLLIMADWLASNPAYFPMIAADEPYFGDMVERAEAAWASIRLPECWQPEMLLGSDGLCERRFVNERGVGFTPNAVQRAVMDAADRAQRPGILILEAQMGVGKTEAALLAAELLSCGMNGQPRRGGIFFGLPTQATANGIFPRVSRWADSLTAYSRASIRLAHGGALLHDDFAGLLERSRVEEDAQDESGLVVHDWFMGRRRELLSNFVIGTVDQLLMAALMQKHVMLRQLGLCGKVVIIDEVHAYDAYMSQYLHTALTWLGAFGVPVILLSATLPPARRGELVRAYLGSAGRDISGPWEQSIAYPLLTWTDGGAVHQEAIGDHFPGRVVRMVRAAFAPDDASALAATLAAALQNGGCAGVIVNTVKRAQRIAEALSQALPGMDVLLLHAQFVMTDRTRHENELLRRVGKRSGRAERDRLIVVGTQVIEQSLDIDLDFLVTDLCPMDLLLQRIGRLHRHDAHDSIRPEGLRQPTCVVLGADGPLEPGGKAVYGEYLLLRTSALLPERIALPGDIPALVRDVYDESVPVAGDAVRLEAARQAYDLLCAQRRERAGKFCLRLPKRMTRFAKTNTLVGLMDCDYRADDAHAEAAVRDGEPSIDVLLMTRCPDGGISPIDSREVFSLDHVPDAESCKAIARRRLRLPRALCSPWQRANQTIDELERRNAAFAEWRQSAWLRGELILLLDENRSAELCGYRLTYDSETGLHCAKEDADEGKGV